MQVQPTNISSQSKVISPARGKVFIDYGNMRKVSEMLDAEGNVIDPKSKRIIRKKDEEIKQ